METPKDMGTTKPCKTWFIERGDGFIFACDEAEAWGLFHNRTEWMRRDFKIIGVSDGTTYFSIIRNSSQEMQKLKEELMPLKRSFDKYSETEDRLRFDELLDDTDEKVQKVTQLLTDLQVKITEIENKIKNFQSELINKAFNAELEIARGNIELPTNHDIITPNRADRDKILAKLQ